MALQGGTGPQGPKGDTGAQGPKGDAGAQGPPGASLNPQQLATLRWYEASQNGQTFAVGNSPMGIAFDGANIWVANNGDNTVSKLRSSDGNLQGTYPVGTAPNGLAFDGANIWVANSLSNNVCKR